MHHLVSKELWFDSRMSRQLIVNVLVLLFGMSSGYAICNTPAGTAGQILFNANFHVPQYCDGLNWIALGKTESPQYLNSLTFTGSLPSVSDIYSDGNYIYVTDYANGIRVYSFDGTSIVQVASNNTNSTTANGVWGDSNYIYVADGTSGIDVYSKYDGSVFTYRYSTGGYNVSDVWGDGTYIYSANQAGGVEIYTKYNGTSMTFQIKNNSTSDGAKRIWGDSSYVYVADGAGPNGGIDVYGRYTGSNFTLIASNKTNTVNAVDVWTEGSYIFAADGTGYLDAYSFNGTTLTYLASTSQSASSVWGDGKYIYTAHNTTSGLNVYSFNGSQFIRISSSTTSPQRAIWGDNNFFYIVTTTTNNLVAYRRYGCINPKADLSAFRYSSDWRTPQYCDGINWKSTGPKKRTFSPAVSFDGANDYLLRGGDLTTSADSKLFSGSFWFRRNAVNNARQTIYCILDTGSTCRFEIHISTTNKVSIYGKSTGGGSEILNFSAGNGAQASTPITDLNWHHVMFSFDLSNSAKRAVYIDGIIQTLDVGLYVDAVIDFTRTQHSVGAATDGTSKFNGEIDDLWLKMGTYIDFSIPENREKFRNAEGQPVDLGETGSAPIGVSPEVYLSSRQTGLANWHTNKGNGGGFTLTGTLSQSFADLPNFPCNHSPGSLHQVGSIATTNARSVWTNGNYIFLGDLTGGLKAFTFNGSTFTQVAQIATNSAGSLWGDNSYIYLADAGLAQGFKAYSFNGTSFTLKSTVGSNGATSIWGDGSYIYMVESTTPWALRAYTFNGSNFTLAGSTSIDSSTEIFGNGQYIFVADPGASLIRAFTFDGSSFSQKGSIIGIGSVTNIWADKNYFYTPLAAYTFNGSTFTLNAGTPGGLGDVWGDGKYLYKLVGNVLSSHSFDGITFTQLGTAALSSTNEIWGDGNYLYVADGTSGLKAFTATGMCECSGPNGKEGSLKYNSTYSTLQYCDGQSWQRMGK
jgi:hypothetical protein